MNHFASDGVALQPSDFQGWCESDAEHVHERDEGLPIACICSQE